MPIAQALDSLRLRDTEIDEVAASPYLADARKGLQEVKGTYLAGGHARS